jgi:cysteine desulfurase/selenocysteine lyase
MSTGPEAIASLRALFPALADETLVPLDNAATTHRPQAVLDASMRFYRSSNANVHRANHRLGMAATEAYEGARRRVARFLEAEAGEVVFTSNATEAINLVARGWLEPRLSAGDVVLVTALEHHSNLVPWQQVALRTGARLAVLDIDEHGRLAEPVEFPEGTRFLAATRVSNALGTLVDTSALVEQAQRCDIPVLLDVTQSAGHLPMDAGTRAADFLALSAHKMYGPMGVGVLRGRAERLAEMEPVVYGGEMVESVSQEAAVWQEPPWRFEAGTPAVAPVVAFPPALDLLDRVGLAAVRAHELELLGQLLDGLAGIEGLEVVGPPTAEERSGAVSLAIPGGDPHVAGTILDLSGVAVRAGWHCAEPLLRRMGRGPTLRASVAIYSSAGDVERLLEALPEAVAACRDPAPNH